MPILIQQLDVGRNRSLDRKNIPSRSSDINQDRLTIVREEIKDYKPRTVDLDLPIDNARSMLKNSLFFKIFVVLSTLTSLAEPILVGFPPHGTPYYLQIAFLAASSVLFIIGLIMTGSVIQGTDKYPINTVIDRITACFDGEVILELSFLIFGKYHCAYKTN